MDLVTAFRIFDRAVETGSFSQVAREMGMSQPAAARHITMLEQRFGVALLHRSTRGIALTEAGRNLIEHARSVIDAVSQAEAALEGGRAVSGRVRVGVTVSFGHFLLERLEQLLDAHPGLVVELVMRDGFGSMIEENIDVAIRTGEVTDASLIMRLAAENGRFVVAAPSYIESHGVPETPFDLSHHDCIAYTADTDEYEWRFASGDDGNEMVAVPISGRLRFNNRYAIRQAVLKGLGVGLLQHYMIADDITSGRLIRLLPENEPRPIPIHIVYPSRATLTRRTRVVIDWLLTVLKDTVGFAAQN
jgi:DNA-binding transcriptional LysR family regulator